MINRLRLVCKGVQVVVKDQMCDNRKRMRIIKKIMWHEKGQNGLTWMCK